MVGTLVWPLALGFLAMLGVITGNGKSDGAADAADASTFGEVASSVHHDVEHATSMLQNDVSKVETHIAELQRAHDTRFADLHKDLAGIVWELSKLRADMARWQALAQLGARGSSRSNVGGAAAAAGASPKNLPGPQELPDSARLPAPDPGGSPAVGQAAGGGRAWRDS